MTDRPKPEFVENPKLTLYAFHLCHDLALGSGQRVEDSDRLWENFAKLGQELAIAIANKLTKICNTIFRRSGLGLPQGQ